MSQNTLSSASQSDRKPLLNVDFSHQISFGYDLKDESVYTLRVIREELTGIFGALIHLLQTTEENKLGAAIATCIAQELKNFDSLLDESLKEHLEDDSSIEKLKKSHAELEKMNNVLDECLDESKNDQFGFNLVLTVHKRLQDMEAVMNAYCEQSKMAIEGGAE